LRPSRAARAEGVEAEIGEQHALIRDLAFALQDHHVDEALPLRRRREVASRSAGIGVFLG